MKFKIPSNIGGTLYLVKKEPLHKYYMLKADFCVYDGNSIIYRYHPLEWLKMLGLVNYRLELCKTLYVFNYKVYYMEFLDSANIYLVCPDGLIREYQGPSFDIVFKNMIHYVRK